MELIGPVDPWLDPGRQELILVLLHENVKFINVLFRKLPFKVVAFHLHNVIKLGQEGSQELVDPDFGIVSETDSV